MGNRIQKEPYLVANLRTSFRQGCDASLAEDVEFFKLFLKGYSL